MKGFASTSALHLDLCYAESDDGPKITGYDYRAVICLSHYGRSHFRVRFVESR